MSLAQVRRVLLAASLLLAPPARADDAPTVRAYGSLTSRAAVDTRFDSLPGDRFEENVFDLRERLTAGLDAQLSPKYRLLLEARARHRFVEKRAGVDETFLLFNGRRQKAEFELDAGEAYLDYYSPRFDLRLGRQIFAWGANLAFAPADNLNPTDLRTASFTGDPSEAKLPVLAASIRGELGPLEGTLAWVPFFESSRYAVFGQDDALLQPALASIAPDLSPLIDLSLEDRVQPFVAETQRPQGFLTSGDLGARLTSKALGPKLGVSYLFTREKLPRVSLDPKVSQLINDVTRQRPVEESELRAILDRLRRGEKLSQGYFPRYQIIAAEASHLLGPVQLDLDVSFSPARTTYNTFNLQPVFRPATTLVAGISDARGEELLASLTFVALIVPGVEQGTRLLFLDREGAEATRHTAMLTALIAAVGTVPQPHGLSGELRAVVELTNRSFALAPHLSWRFTDLVLAGLGGEFYAGPALSGLGYFKRNDAIFADVRLSF